MTQQEPTLSQLKAELAALRTRVGELERLLDSNPLMRYLNEQNILLQSIPDAVIVLDPDFHIQSWNNAAEVLYGWNQADVVGRPLHAIIPTVQYADETTDESVLEMLQQHMSWRGEVVQWDRAGHELLIDSSMRRICDEHSEIVAYIVVNRDITVQRQAEERLYLFEGAVAASNSGIVITDARLPDHPIVYANAAFEQITGYSVDEVMGRNCRFLQQADTDQLALAQVRMAVLAGEPCQVLLSNYRKDGTPFWNELRIAPIHDAYGKLTHFVGIISDVTSQRHVEEELRHNMRLARSIIDATPDMVYVYDLIEHRSVYANQQVSQVLGYTPYEIQQMGTQVFLRLHPDDLPKLAAHEQHFNRLRDGEVIEWEYRIQTAFGDWRWIFSRDIIFQRQEDGTPRLALGVGRDITARRQAEAERQDLERRLLEVQKFESLGMLAGAIAHDFNNLLVAILGNAGLALMELPYGSAARDSIAQIELTARRAADLTRQLLTYAGKGRLTMQRINVNDLVEEMIRLLQTSIPKHVTLRSALAPRLPAVEADGTQVRQVIMNLVINAAEAIGKQSGTINVTTGVMEADQQYLRDAYPGSDLPAGKYVYVEVVDTGMGMDAATRVRIFEPFFTTKPEGRGLGLAAVAGIAHRHKGALIVFSEVGRGSTFRFLLPITHMPAEVVSSEQTGNSDWHGRGTVLVIDDEADVRSVAARMLERFGFAVLQAADGQLGLELLLANKSSIACVLLDMAMPQLSGEETFREIRRVNPDVRVILMSGYNEDDIASRFADKKPAGFLHKPFTPQVLRSRLQQVFGDA